MTQQKLSVSDHAVLRYLERVIGLNINAVRRKIEKVDPDTIAAIDEFGGGTGKIKTADYTAVVKGRTIVTVYPND